jgi:hypothetical protein
VCNSQGLCPLPLMPVIEDSDKNAIEVYDRYGNNVTDAAIIQGGFSEIYCNTSRRLVEDRLCMWHNSFN